MAESLCLQFPSPGSICRADLMGKMTVSSLLLAEASPRSFRRTREAVVAGGAACVDECGGLMKNLLEQDNGSSAATYGRIKLQKLRLCLDWPWR